METSRPVQAPLNPPPEDPCAGQPADPNVLVKDAIELLDLGHTKDARSKLECALSRNPDQARVQTLLDQLDIDPDAPLCRQSFSYTVGGQETLSQIAQRFLNDNLKFVSLARCNRIAVPADLKAGQQIRIPGTAPASSLPLDPAERAAREEASSLRKEALSAETAGDLERAYVLIAQAQERYPTLTAVDSQLDRIKKDYIDNLQDAAYRQEVVGDPEAAVQLWRKILSIQGDNVPAQLALRRLGER